MASSRTPSGALQTTGAGESGKIPGIDGRLPVVSRIAPASAIIAACPFVRLYEIAHAGDLTSLMVRDLVTIPTRRTS
jgi:hypothetical protein